MRKLIYSFLFFSLGILSMTAQVTSTRQGEVPDSHPIHQMRSMQSNYTFADVDAFYRREIEKADGLDHTTNLKNMGFHLVMEKGLLKEGTDVQKKYYLDQQMSLESNLPNFTNFYRLLVASRNLLGLKQAMEYARSFQTKNQMAIENLELDDAGKEDLSAQLSQARILFEELGVY